MTFATFTNVALMLLCVAVLVQSARMMKSFSAIRSGDLGATVKSLDNATAQARTVLAELRETLATDGAANARAIASGEALRDELSVMVGIGNSVAERIMEAAANAGEKSSSENQHALNHAIGDDGAGGSEPAKPQSSGKSRSRRRKKISVVATGAAEQNDAASLVAMAVAEVEAEHAAAAAA